MLLPLANLQNGPRQPTFLVSWEPPGQEACSSHQPRAGWLGEMAKKFRSRSWFRVILCDKLIWLYLVDEKSWWFYHRYSKYDMCEKKHISNKKVMILKSEVRILTPVATISLSLSLHRRLNESSRWLKASQGPKQPTIYLFNLFPITKIIWCRTSIMLFLGSLAMLPLMKPDPLSALEVKIWLLWQIQPHFRG